MKNRIDDAFKRTQEANQAAFMPFITAGDPDLKTTAELIREIAARGADLIEIGIPYSDPIADGPTIQNSYTRALAGGLRTADVLDMISEIRSDCRIPILTMVSLSIVARVGAENYFTRAAMAGVDGVIIPDLPADEGRHILQFAEKEGLHPVLLAAPTTTEKRLQMIARRSRGFIYYISVAGTTGARRELPPDLANHVNKLKSMTKTPVAVGFGVSSPDQVAAISKIADGVIVGSAIVRKIEELAGSRTEELCAGVGEFVATLAAAKSRSIPAEKIGGNLE